MAAYAALAADGKTAVSTRSSANTEDLAGHSFAGRYSSYLNNSGDEQVLDGVRQVWASSFNREAVDYCFAHHIEPSSIRMAVIVQKMVEARVSGTPSAFHPETGRPFLGIGAVPGLGGGVGGSTNSEYWVVDPHDFTIIKRRGRASDAGTPPRVELDSTLVEQLARGVCRVADHFQITRGTRFVQTEYSVCQAGTIWYLQARPETVWAQAGAQSWPSIRSRQNRSR